MVMPWRALSSRRNSAATRGSSLDPAAPEHQPDEVEDGPADGLAEDRIGHLGPRLERDGRVGQHAPDALVGRDRRGVSSSVAPCLDRVVARGDLEGGLGVAACGRFASGHQFLEFFDPPDAGPRRNSSTRRRWRSSVIVSPTTLLGREEGQIGDLGPDVRDRARLLRLDLGGGPDAQALELLAGRGDIRVARLLGDLLGAGQDLVRLAAGLAERGDALRLRVLAIAARLFGVLETLLDPILAVGQHLRDRLERERPDDDEEQDEVERADDHPEEVDLEQRRFALGGQLRDVAACPAWRRPGCPRG